MASPSRQVMQPGAAMVTAPDQQEPLPGSVSPAMSFQVLARQGRARASRMTLPHYEAHTPMFMPVGTQGTFVGVAGRPCDAACMQHASFAVQVHAGRQAHALSRSWGWRQSICAGGGVQAR